MHQISLQSISKKFDHGFLFKDLSLELKSGVTYAITGTNGSGKSTLLQIISSYVSPDKGRVEYIISGEKINADKVSLFTSIAAPSMELFLSLSLRETIAFHFTHKNYKADKSETQLAKIIGLEKHLDKPLKNFSSGMLQKVKLGLAMYSDSYILLLDEPTSNLDELNKAWFYEQFQATKSGKIIVIASNEKEEIALSSEQINL